ncbi:MAG: hypothetical protein MUQ32_03310, partial [Chloroflexi bacterium]|nr:hypothetical protein [Chloroflexota bacterium]
MRPQRIGKRVREPGVRLIQRVEAILPPQPEDAQRAGLAVDAGLDPAHEPVAVQERQDVVAPAALRGRDVDLPAVVEAPQAQEQVPVPGERVQRCQEDGTGVLAARAPDPPGFSDPCTGGLRRQLGLGSVQDPDLVRDDEPGAAYALHRDGEQRAHLDQLRPQTGPARRVSRPGPERVLARRAQQAVAAVPGEQLVAALLSLRRAPGQEARREEALREVVDAAVALAAGDRQDARLAQRLQDRAHLVRRAPVPVDGRA